MKKLIAVALTSFAFGFIASLGHAQTYGDEGRSGFYPFTVDSDGDVTLPVSRTFTWGAGSFPFNIYSDNSFAYIGVGGAPRLTFNVGGAGLAVGTTLDTQFSIANSTANRGVQFADTRGLELVGGVVTSLPTCTASTFDASNVGEGTQLFYRKAAANRSMHCTCVQTGAATYAWREYGTTVGDCS